MKRRTTKAPGVEPLRPGADDGSACLFSGPRPGRFEPSYNLYEVVPEFRFADLQLPMLPRPPKIPPGAIENAHAVHCSMWLKGWVEKNFGETPRYSRRTRYDKRRNWKAMRDGIAILQKHRVSAPRWISFYALLWEGSGQLRAPAVSSVFSRGVITEYVGPAMKQIPELGGRIVRLPRAQRLGRTHTRMMQAIMSRRPQTQRAAAAIVAEFLPGRSFSSEMARLRAEADAERMKLEKAMTKSEWIW